MKLALIHPAGSNWVPGKKDVTLAVNRMPPIGLLCLGAYAERAGAEVKILDMLGGGEPEELQAKLDEIIKWKPDIIGFTATTSSFLDGYEKTKYIKERDPSIKIVFGGVHVSSMVTRTLKDYPLIDYAVVGEGEIPLLKLLEGNNPAAIHSLVYHDGGEVKFTGRPDKAVELDDLPFPAYHLLEGFPKKYSLPLFNAPSGKGAPIISSRGCPYTCSYCDRSVYGRSFRHNSADYLFRHMVYLNDNYGIKHFNIYDDLFTLKRKRVVEVCEKLAASRKKFTFNSILRLGHVDRELLKILKKGGCWMVSLGIESGDQALLDHHKAGVDLNEVNETVKLIHSEGLRAKGLFIMGLPGETPETVERTKEYIKNVNLDDMNLAKFTPFPGSPIYSEIREHGELVEDWRKFNCMNFVFRPKGFETWGEMDRLYSETIMSFYGNPIWRRKLVPMLIKYPHNLVTILKNLRGLLEARKYFEPSNGHGVEEAWRESKG